MGNSLRFLVITLWVLVSMQVSASPAIPGEKCPVEAHSSWSEAETWSWVEICEGRIADFFGLYGTPLKLEDSWDDNSKDRHLSQRFIETMLLHEPWRNAIPRQGVRFVGAIFPEGINLSTAKIPHEVWFEDSHILQHINFIFSSFDGLVSLDGSVVEGNVRMEGLLVAGNLNLRNTANFKGEVKLSIAKVGGVLSMVGSTFEDKVFMDGLRVAGNLFMFKGANFKDKVWLRGAKIGGQLGMDGSTFEGEMIMDNLHVAGNLYMRGPAIFRDAINLNGVKVGGSLDLSDALVSEIDLEGANISGGLRLGTRYIPRTRWREGGRLILSNAQMDRIEDQLDDEGGAWPSEIYFDGLTYKRLGGSKRDGSKLGMIDRDATWYIAWLARDPNYSPQPYEQLASVFRAAGHPAKANTILYAGRERERINATGLTRLGLETLKWTIGYGLGTRYFRALWWVAGLVALGMLVLRISGEGQRNMMPYGFSFSLDLLLPIVTLRKYHFDVTLAGWPRYYFYCHKLMGYVLASFLIAGMAGLTQ